MIRSALILALSLLAASCATAPVVNDLGLPLIELPVSGSGKMFAVILSGDGGWRPVDKHIAARLMKFDVPVVGFLSPDYFGTRRTPEESAAALESILRTYMKRWNRPEIIVIGYSRGADALPFMLTRLPASLRQSIRVTALLGLEANIDFKYHPSWIPFYHPQEPQFAVRPEIEKLQGMKILCIHGEKETDSLCPAISPALATEIREPGGHHFAGHYQEIADKILAAAK